MALDFSPVENTLRAQKQQLLDAVAVGGTAARQALEANQAQINQTRQESVNAALQSAAARPDDRMLTQRNQQTDDLAGRQTGLATRRDTATQDYLKSIQATGGAYADAAMNRIPAIKDQMEAELAAQLARSGGHGGGGWGGHGGGGGGGGGGDNHPYWWNWYYENGLNKTFGGASSGGLTAFKNAVKDEAAYGDRDRLTGYTRRQQVAQAYGAPQAWAEGKFPTTPAGHAANRALAFALENNVKPQALFQNLRSLAQNTPGNQTVLRRQTMDQYRAATGSKWMPKKKGK